MSVNINAVKGIFVNLGGFCKTNAPVIFAGAAVLGVVGTIVSAVKATHKADEVINECDEPKELAFKDKAAMTWKYYIPTAVLGVGTIACIIGGTSVGVRRLAAATLAYEAANGKLNAAKEEFDKLLGEDGKKIFDTATTEKKHVEFFADQVDINGNAIKFWVVDPFGVRWYTDKITLLHNQNLLNDEIITTGSATVNDWYTLNDQEYTTAGSYFTWDRDDWDRGKHLLDIDFENAKTINGIPHLCIDYNFGERYISSM